MTLERITRTVIPWLAFGVLAYIFRHNKEQQRQALLVLVAGYAFAAKRD